VPREARAVDYAGILRASLKASGLASGQRVVVDPTTQIVKSREEIRILVEKISRGDLVTYEVEDILRGWLSHSSPEVRDV
jgi:hypothetical protein